MNVENNCILFIYKKRHRAFGTELALKRLMMTVARYACYRHFLKDYLESKGYSYRQFAAKYSTYVSFPLLSKVLRQNSRGEFVAETALRPERLAALLKAMGLDGQEIKHLLLCRLKSDQRSGSYRHSATFTHVLESLRNTSAAPVDRQEQNWIEGLKALHPRRRQRVIEELCLQLKIEKERSATQLQAEVLSNILDEVSA